MKLHGYKGKCSVSAAVKKDRSDHFKPELTLTSPGWLSPDSHGDRHFFLYVTRIADRMSNYSYEVQLSWLFPCNLGPFLAISTQQLGAKKHLFCSW